MFSGAESAGARLACRLLMHSGTLSGPRSSAYVHPPFVISVRRLQSAASRHHGRESGPNRSRHNPTVSRLFPVRFHVVRPQSWGAPRVPPQLVSLRLGFVPDVPRGDRPCEVAGKDARRVRTEVLDVRVVTGARKRSTQRCWPSIASGHPATPAAGPDGARGPAGAPAPPARLAAASTPGRCRSSTSARWPRTQATVGGISSYRRTTPAAAAGTAIRRAIADRLMLHFGPRPITRGAGTLADSVAYRWRIPDIDLHRAPHRGGVLDGARPVVPASTPTGTLLTTATTPA